MPEHDLLTAADIRAAVERLKSNVRVDRCPPHVLHPRWVGPEWELVGHELPAQEGDKLVGCANLCGTWFAFRPVSRAQ